MKNGNGKIKKQEPPKYTIKDFRDNNAVFDKETQARIDATIAVLKAIGDDENRKKMSKPKFPLFDTNSVIEHRREIEAEKTLMGKMRLSTVVYYELTATTIDASMFKFYEKWFKLFDKSGLLLTPTTTDWYETSKIIRRLRFGEKSASHGKTPKIHHARKLQNDALIARTARENNCFVVTTDVDDFELFLPFMKNLIIVSAADFFG